MYDSRSGSLSWMAKQSGLQVLVFVSKIIWLQTAASDYCNCPDKIIFDPAVVTLYLLREAMLYWGIWSGERYLYCILSLHASMLYNQHNADKIPAIISVDVYPSYRAVGGPRWDT